MYTGVYFPKDGWVNCPTVVVWTCSDDTSILRDFHWNESPSYSVRLLVFEMPED